MAKKRRKKATTTTANRNQNNNNQANKADTDGNRTLETKADTLHLEAITEPSSVNADINNSKNASNKELTTAVEKAEEARNIFVKMKEEYEEKNEKLDQEEKKAEDNKRNIQKREKELGEKEKKYIELQKKEESLIAKEAEAEAGFLNKRDEILGALQAEKEKLKKRIFELKDLHEAEFKEHLEKLSKSYMEHEEKINKEREKQENKLNKLFDERLEQIESERKQEEVNLKKEWDLINQANEKLEKEQADHQRAIRRLELDQNIVKQDISAIEETIKFRVTREIERKEEEIDSLHIKINVKSETIKELEKKLNEHEQADKLFEHMSKDKIKEKMEALEAENQALKAKEHEYDKHDELVEQHNQLKEKYIQKNNDLTDLQEKCSRYESQLGKSKISVLSMESLRDEKTALETGNKLLKSALEELREDIEERVEGKKTATPFPACFAMDDLQELQESVALTDEIKDLSKFAQYIRHLMAQIHTDKVLYYSDIDIRSFIAGLNMSKLHILQGISGTGKTSLPIAFAEAIGAGHTLVEVQAGWRDKHDLVGYYNTFEKLYHETDFLQALYKAQCPIYRDSLYIIVLDEMNLSHPEQYFADFLSQLEQEIPDRKVVLREYGMDRDAPKLFLDRRMIRIPENVWFVGTANNDETTKTFADKTFDRAHVMELPEKYEKFKIDNKRRLSPISYKALQNAFDSACNEYQSHAEEVFNRLEDEYRTIFGKYFGGISWGNRLKNQISRYVPVVVASGGSRAEAFDRILAMKILRKIRNRYDNRVKKIEELKEKTMLVLYDFGMSDKDISKHSMSIKIIDSELIRLEAYDE